MIEYSSFVFYIDITKVLGDPKGFGILVLKTEMRFYNSIYSSSQNRYHTYIYINK